MNIHKLILLATFIIVNDCNGPVIVNEDEISAIEDRPGNGSYIYMKHTGRIEALESPNKILGLIYPTKEMWEIIRDMSRRNSE